MFTQPATTQGHIQSGSRSAPDVCPLEARKLTFSRGRTVVLRKLDLAVACGETVAILGCNGAGKTTLLQCLAGLLRPAAGEVRWFGEAVSRSAPARRRIGFLGHESGLYQALTARENLLFAGRMYGLDHAGDRVAEVLSAFHLDSHADRQVGLLSRGMRQRLAIARAVLHDPAVLLFDEPFTSLDTTSRDSLAACLGELRRTGLAILMTSHDAAQSLELADRVLWLEAGRLSLFEDSAGE